MSRLVFLDYETTGLKATSRPIELACVVTDDAFVELDSFECLLALPNSFAYHDWEPEARAMHDSSGLKKLVERHGIPPDDARVLFRYFLKKHEAAGPLHLAGNSVHFDRGFLWPEVEKMFHHRHLDVSSIRMLGERVRPGKKFDDGKAHRAMADVRASLAELKFWTQVLTEKAQQ